jgi:hypothetical protein
VLFLNECSLLLLLLFISLSLSPDTFGYALSIALGYGMYDPGFETRQELGMFLFTTASRPVLGPPSLLSSGYQGLISWGLSGWCLKLTTHLHLLPRSRMRAAIPPLPNTLSWHGAELKYRDNFTFTEMDSEEHVHVIMNICII